MAASFYDYVIADPVTLPDSDQLFYDERIVQLPDCYQCNDSARSHLSHSRQAAGLPETGFVFACFNLHRKIARPVFDIWMRLLAAVPGSLLWLLADSADQALKTHAAARGIDPRRLVFAPKIDPQSHLGRAACADLMLDTLPYNAHTTASDALWMGVPLVTCRGAAFAGRVAASVLSAVGLPELITETLEDYEALALSLARNGEKLRAVKEKLAANRLTAPLFDADRFRRHIEQAYVQMIETARSGQEPRAFRVAPVKPNS
jgi:predicted O-linked N-acetylglucosamine transferase (SPINDLY family)